MAWRDTRTSRGRLLLFSSSIVLGVAALALLSPGGWRLFAFLLARCTLCLLAMVLLANTTPFADLLRVLKRFRVPALMVTTLALMYRYLFVLADEAQRMKRARASRTAWWSLRSNSLLGNNSVQ